jgi:hypothetical protein
MAVSLIGPKKEREDERYVVQPQYYKEINLFEAAGIR